VPFERGFSMRLPSLSNSISSSRSVVERAVGDNPELDVRLEVRVELDEHIEGVDTLDGLGEPHLAALDREAQLGEGDRRCRAG
jgi:hypothetical protein